MRLYSRLLNAILLFCCLSSCLEDTTESTEFHVNKNWKFIIGDSITYARPNLNDDTWLGINEIKKFSDCGYKNYDGYAWYRCNIKLPKNWQNDSTVKKFDLLIGQIDDCDQVYFNGHLLGSNGIQGNFEFKTENSSYNVTRHYEIENDKKFIDWSKSNILAIRVFDKGGEGGIYSKVYIKPSRFDLSKQYDLENRWWFNNSDSQLYSSKYFDDSKWTIIQTGDYWEAQGFGAYNGYGWYRNKFKLPLSIKEEIKNNHAKLQLVLGKIDDLDQVYINGHLIGENGKDISSGEEGSPNFSSFKTLAGIDRIYTIYNVDKIITWDSENIIAIRVFDSGGDGGIIGKVFLRLKYSEFDVSLDVSKLYQVNNHNLLDTFAIIHNNDYTKRFKGKFKCNVYSAQVSKDDKMEWLLDMKPRSSIKVPISIPTSKEDVNIDVRIEDEYFTTVLYQHIKLPFVLSK